MPTLNWIGKEKIVNHDKDVPFRLMRKNKKYSLGNSENLILEGDNLEALKALMPFYYGKIKCIYIDPPYNTGNEKWVYNDKVNSPKIKEWLGKVVGPEGDDLCRHDKWLCMMYPRLKLLKELLSDDGAIFISIDDNEHCNLKMAMDEIFGLENFIANIIWEKSDSPKMDVKLFSENHDFIMVYSKSFKDFSLNKKITKEIPAHYNKIDAKNRVYYLKPLRVMGGNISESLYFPMIAPDGVKVFPLEPDGTKSCWRWSRGKVENEKERIEWVRGSKGWVPYFKIYADSRKEEQPFTIWKHDEVGSNRTSKNEIRKIFRGTIFETPKPTALIKKIINLSTINGDIVLDSFAGSGTTAHVVLDLNKEDGGNRKFILVEMEKNIAKNITAERVKRVAKGYSYKKNGGEAVKVLGLGGGFEYVELGEPLFDKDGTINKTVSFEDMARYVYFTETRTNLEKKNIKGNYLGEFGSSHYFLLFKGIDKNILDRKFLKELKGKSGRKVIYADKCLLDDDVLERNQIVFKQIPYQVKVY